MNQFVKRLAAALRLAQGKTEVYIGEVRGEAEVVAIKVPLERALFSHFNNGMYGDFRWRARTDADTVFWWNYSDVTPAMKYAVETYLAAHGLVVRKHAGNTQQIKVGDQTLWGATYSHGGGRQSRRRAVVTILA